MRAKGRLIINYLAMKYFFLSLIMFCYGASVAQQLVEVRHINIFSLSVCEDPGNTRWQLKNISPLDISIDSIVVSMHDDLHFLSLNSQATLLSTRNDESTFVLGGMNNIASGDSTAISYFTEASCAGIQANGSSDTLKVYARQNGMVFHQEFLIGPRQIQAAALNIIPSSLKDSISGNQLRVGDTIHRSCKVINSGNGNVSLFSFSDATIDRADSSALVIFDWMYFNGSVWLPLLTNLSNDTVRIDSSILQNIGNLDGVFDACDTLCLKYKIRLQSCPSGGILNTTPSVGKYCRQEYCLGENLNATQSLSLAHAKPGSLNIELIEKTDDYCMNDNSGPHEIIYSMVNTDTLPMWNAKVQVDVGTFHIVSSRIDTSQVYMRVANQISWQKIVPIKTTNGNPSSNPGFGNCGYTDYIRSMELKFDRIDPGDTLYIRFPTYTCVDPNSCSSTYLLHNGLRYSFEGPCGVFKYQHGFTYPRLDALSAGSLHMNAPTQIFPGDTFSMEVELNPVIRAFSEHDSAAFKFEFILPQGISWPGSPNSYSLQEICLAENRIADSVLVNGDTLSFIYPTSGGINFNGGGSLIENLFSLKDLTIDCTVLGSSISVFAEFRMSYVPDLNCPNPAWFSLACETIELRNACYSSYPNGGIELLKPIFERLNAGVPDNDEDGLPDLPPYPQVDSFDRSRVTIGDTIGFHQGGVVNLANQNVPFVNLEQVSTIDKGKLMRRLDVQIKIWDASASVSYSGLSSDTTYFAGALDSVSYGLFIKPQNLTWLPNTYQFEDGDSVEISTWFKVIKNHPLEQTLIDIQNEVFLLDHLGPDSLGTSLSCGASYSNLNLHRYDIYTYMPSGVIEGCQEKRKTFDIYPSFEGGKPIFQKEYLTLSKVDKLMLIPPEGFELSNFQLNHIYIGRGWCLPSSNLTNQNIPITPGFKGDTIVLELDSVLPDTFNQVLRQQISFNVNAICGLESGNYFIDYLATLEHDAARSGILPDTVSGRRLFSYASPDLRIKPLSPKVVDGLNGMVFGDIQLENNSSIAVPYPGIYFDTPTTIAIQKIENLNTGQSQNLSNGWMYLDSLSGNSQSPIYRIWANYYNCEQDSFNLYTSWSCDGFPSSITEAACTPIQETFYIEPKKSGLSLQNIIPDSSAHIDLCEAIEMELSISTTNLALVDSIIFKALKASIGEFEIIPGSSKIAWPDTSLYTVISDPVETSSALIWNLENLYPQLPGGGLPGIIHPDSSQLKIRFQVQANCNFVSGTRLEMEATGLKPCGEYIDVARSFSEPILINGINESYSVNINSQWQDLSYCELSTQSFILNYPGTVPSNTGDSIYLTYPPEIALIKSSIQGNFSRNNSRFGIAPNGDSLLVMPVPQLISPTDSLSLSFDLMSTSLAECGDYDINLQVLRGQTGFCGNDTCRIFSPLGSVSTNLSVRKPQFSLDINSTSWDLVNDTAIVNMLISPINLPPRNHDLILIEYYLDDGSGVYDSADSLIGSNLILGNPIANPFNFSDTLDLSGIHINSSPTLIAVISSENNCVCTTEVEINDYVLDYTIDERELARTILSGGINIYPNPVQDSLHIKGNFKNGLEVEVLNSNGQLLEYYSSNSLNITHKRINLSRYPSGMYFIKIRSGMLQWVDNILVQ